MTGRRSAILTVDQVAQVLNITAAEVRGMVADGELTALVALGDDLLIAEAALREFIDHAWVGEPVDL